MPDTGAVSSGKIKTTVINQGTVTLTSVMAWAILTGEDGKIVGATKEIVGKDLKPNAAVPLMFTWQRTVGNLVQAAEIWVQPAR